MAAKSKIESVLAQTLLEALRHAASQREAGASSEEVQANLVKTLRAAWPKWRDEPWHYECAHCQDTGWREHICPELHCGRKKPHAGHCYVQTCLCSKGNELRASLIQKQRPSATEEAGARRRAPSRFGR